MALQKKCRASSCRLGCDVVFQCLRPCPGGEPAKLHGALEQRPGGKQITNCIDADSVLDQIRFASTQANDQDASVNLEKYLVALNEELGHPGLGTSDVVLAVIKIMSPWDKPLGILFVHSSKNTYNILLNTNLVGITNWSRRLEPGTYRIRVIRHLDSVYSDNALTITAGETKDIDLDKLTP
jgi:hypothetical protein